jgi:hypothetical protein
VGAMRILTRLPTILAVRGPMGRGWAAVLSIGLALVFAAPSAAADPAPVVVIILENHSYGANDPGVNSDTTKYIVGNPDAPYINQTLIPQGTLFSNYDAVEHPSLADYLDIAAGTNGGCSNSCPRDSVTADNIFHLLGQAGITFRTFAQSMPRNCYPKNSGAYVVRHNPEPYFTNIDAASGVVYGCSTTDVPSPTTWPDPLPAFSTVVPDLCHDMHGSAKCPNQADTDQIITAGDTWLADNVPTLLARGAIVIVTFDEGVENTGGGGHILTTMAGPNVLAGAVDGTLYSHFGLLAGLERYFGLAPLLGSAAVATPLPIPTGPPPTISGFDPSGGGPGDAVTITGSHLTGATTVSFNGAAATFSVVDDSTISASVPSCASTGPITVTTLGGVATSPSEFTVSSAPTGPTVCTFAPTSGPAGTSVTISGANFTGATSVTFNGSPASYTVNSDTQITATVPGGAMSGPITVVTAGGTGSSVSNFTVTTSTGPSISGFTPMSGPVGTSVAITGANFTGATAVRFNGTSASFTLLSDAQITATVPSGATTGPIKVKTSVGAATSASSFTVTASPPPTISSFTPTSGAIGTSVTIGGTGLTGASAVTFNGAAATFTVNSDTQITTVVPNGATTGSIGVTTPGGTATSASSFTVTGPTVSGFMPTSGPVGTTVTITGANLTGATVVKFNGTLASFVLDSDTQIRATVPVGATTGLIKVKTPAGIATSASYFVVT